jgi:hypothetical protein
MMLFDGWKIELTHKKGKRVLMAQSFMTHDLVKMSDYKILQLNFDKMLYEIKKAVKKSKYDRRSFNR